MSKYFWLTIIIYFTSILILKSQSVIIEGYVYEEGNRGFLNAVVIDALDKETMALKGKASTNLDGVFRLELPVDGEYILKASKKIFELKEIPISTKGKNVGEKIYVKVEMMRKPGYLFEVTMAEKRVGDHPVDAISGAWIEVYNNTTNKEILNIKDHSSPTFNVQFEQGNHYTIMIRKSGFFVKRMEAYVNVEGCILCFDGVGEVTPEKPGISDVLTERNTMGTLLANVELIPIKMNEPILIKNIYYELAKWSLKEESQKELDNLFTVLNDNPNLLVEIGSHTDCRGKDRYNLKLSQQRANEVVSYLLNRGINKNRIIPKGYGETQLTNECEDGVKCSERRHALNRRTELKVVGLAHENLNENKSLSQFKEEENFEQILAELENSEIKVMSDEELPEEVKNQIAKKEEPSTRPGKKDVPKKKNSNNPPPKYENEQKLTLDENPFKEKNKKINNPTKPAKKKAYGSTIYSNKKLEKDKMAALENAKNKSETEISEKNKMKETEQPEEILNNNPENKEVSFKETTEDFNDTFEDNTDQQKSKIITEQPVSSTANAYVRIPKNLDINYSGYKVEFFTSPYKLPSSHEIFLRHGNITIEERKDGSYAYLLGNFKSEKDAESFLKSIIQDRYADARVIAYSRGNRLN